MRSVSAFEFHGGTSLSYAAASTHAPLAAAHGGLDAVCWLVWFGKEDLGGIAVGSSDDVGEFREVLVGDWIDFVTGPGVEGVG